MLTNVSEPHGGLSGIRGVLGRCRPRDALFLGIIITIGVTLCAVVTTLLADSESELAEKSARAAFTAAIDDFGKILSDRLLAIRAIADALSVLPRDASLEAVQTVRDFGAQWAIFSNTMSRLFCGAPCPCRSSMLSAR